MSKVVEGGPHGYGPMPIAAYQEERRHVDWATAVAQPDYHGTRVRVSRDMHGAVHCWNGKLLAAPGHLVSALQRAVGRMQLDVVFTQRSAAESKKHIWRHDAQSRQLICMVVDCIYGEDPTASFQQRYRWARELVANLGVSHVQLAEAVKVRSEDELMFCQQRYLLQGHAGVALRSGRDPYGMGPPRQLLRVRTFEEAEFPVEDWKYQGHKTILTCATADGYDFDVLIPWTLPTIGKRARIAYWRISRTEEPVPSLPVWLEFTDHDQSATG